MDVDSEVPIDTRSTQSAMMVSDWQGRRQYASVPRDSSTKYVRAWYNGRRFATVSATALYSALAKTFADIDFSSIRIGHKHMHAVGRVVCKASGSARTFATNVDRELEILQHSRCACAGISTRYKYPISHLSGLEQVDTNHVLTTDISVLSEFGHHELQALLQHGLSHIPAWPIEKAEIIEQLRIFAEDLINSIHCTAAQADAMLEFAGAWTRSCIQELPNEVWIHHVSDESHVSQLAQMLAEHAYIIPLDKAPDTPVIVCSSLYRHLVLKHIMSSGLYQPAPAKHDVQAQYTHDLNQIHASLPHKLHFDKHLPTLQLTFKAHKASFRPITSAFQSCFADIWILAQHITDAIIKLLIPALEREAGKIRLQFGIRPHLFWVVRSSFDAALNVPDYISHLADIDLKTCFDTVPVCPNAQHNVYAAVKWALHIIKQKHQARKLFFVLTATGLVRMHIKLPTITTSQILLDDQQVAQLLHAVCQHSYVASFGYVAQQMQGLPQGANMSPGLNDLFLCYHENRYIQHCILTLPRAVTCEVLLATRTCQRYADDIRCYNASIICDHILNGMVYLAPLQVEPVLIQDTQTGHFESPFLDMLTTVDNGVPRWRMHRKINKLPAWVQMQYLIHSSDERPPSQLSAIIATFVHRILTLSSHPDAALQDCRTLASDLRRNGYTYHAVLAIIRRKLQGMHVVHGRFNAHDVLRLW